MIKQSGPEVGHTVTGVIPMIMSLLLTNPFRFECGKKYLYIADSSPNDKGGGHLR